MNATNLTRASLIGCRTVSVLAVLLLEAHEASDKHPQNGFLFSINDAGRWFELDFTDTHNTCVKIYGDGQARIGGVVLAGNGPQVGRVFGFYLEDNGEPAYFPTRDTRFVSRWSTIQKRRENTCITGVRLASCRAVRFTAIQFCLVSSLRATSSFITRQRMMTERSLKE